MTLVYWKRTSLSSANLESGVSGQDGVAASKWGERVSISNLQALQLKLIMPSFKSWRW